MTYPPQPPHSPYGQPAPGYGPGPDQFGLSGQYASFPPPKQKSKLPLILGISGGVLALVVIVAIVLVITLGGGGGGSSSGPGGRNNSGHSASSLDDAPVDTLRGAMPGQDDFPQGWTVSVSTTKPAVGDLAQLTNDMSVSPAECGEIFKNAFKSSPTGELISITTAMGSSGGQGGSGSPGVIAISSERKPGAHANTAQFDEVLNKCSRITFTMPELGRTMALDLSRVDTSGVTGAQTAGLAATGTSGSHTFTMTEIVAITRGVVVATIGNGPSDQKDLLLKLLKQTVDKLNAL